MRKKFLVPKCDPCYNFGHAKEYCVRMFATTIAGVTVVPLSEHNMGAEKAETAAPGVLALCAAEVKGPSDKALLVQPTLEGSDNFSAMNGAIRPEASTMVAEPPASGVATKLAKRASKKYGSGASSRSRTELQFRAALFVNLDAIEPTQQAAVAAKRNLELNPTGQPGGNQGQQRSLGRLKRSHIHVAPNIEKGYRRNLPLRIRAVAYLPFVRNSEPAFCSVKARFSQ